MYVVEDMMESLITTLTNTIDQQTGEPMINNTYIVFTSDNGYHLGEHRLEAGKLTGFDTDIHVPLIIRGPGIAAGVTQNALTANVDFAPTFADIAGISIPTSVDGRSFKPLLSGNCLNMLILVALVQKYKI
jgi:arylsulfatase A-like enzyme